METNLQTESRVVIVCEWDGKEKGGCITEDHEETFGGYRYIQNQDDILILVMVPQMYS